MITVVLGGARSGKSAVAEGIASRSGEAVTYVATAHVENDPDLRARVEAHRQRRPSTWSTIEVDDDLEEILCETSGTILIDSIGPWLAARPDFAVDTEGLLAALQRPGDTIIVSDEVGLGVHPSTPSGREFRDALGALNQALAGVADRTLLVVAGRTLVLGSENL